MSEYPTGNTTILQMIKGGTFDEALAESLLRDADLNAPICDLSGYSTTYLYEAVSSNSLPAVSFLLRHGADPNLNIPELICDCALWELQYLDDGQDWQTRYAISKLFFRFGADPNIKCDGESLYDYIVYKVYNDPPSDENDWISLLHLYKLLVVFGGGAEDGIYGKPCLKNVDPGKIDEYGIRFSIHDDGYHISGFLVDRDNDHRMAKSIEDSIDFAVKRQVWQRMILKIIRPMLIAMSIWQNSKAVLLRSKAARRKAFSLFAII